MNFNRKNYSRFSFAGTIGGRGVGSNGVRGSEDLRNKDIKQEVIGVYKISSNNRNDNITGAGADSNHRFEQIAGLLKSEKNPTSSHGVLNAEEDDEMHISGYRRSKIRTITCWIGFILTAGILRLVMHWWRHWLLLATHKICPLDVAEKILVRENYQGKHTVYYVKDVFLLDVGSVTEMYKNEMIQSLVNKELIKSTGDNENREDANDLNATTHDSGKEDSNSSNINEVDEGYLDFDLSRPFRLSMHLTDGNFEYVDSVRYFCCKKLRYIWDASSQQFMKLKGLDENVPSIVLHEQEGLSGHEQYTRRIVYGYNEIVIPIKGVITLLFLEVLNPFYVFQVFSVVLWFSYNYYYYAVVIILMSAFGIIMSIRQTLENQKALNSTVKSSDTIMVKRDNNIMIKMNTKYLVPGDVLEIPSNGCTMQCDAVLLSGNCILDESMLTGESVPVTKTPLPCKRDLIYDKKEHARHTLFCGTKVIQTRYIGTEKVLAVVINTGNITAKGGLIRSILYPPPVDYKFEQDSYKFIMLLGCVAGIGFVYTLCTKIIRGVEATKIAIESLDLITIAVPPALPAAMTVGRMYAQKRLKKNNIYCISPRSINVSGSIDCVCFDKTGTLTEDGLDMWGVLPKSETNYFQIPLRNIRRLPCDHLLYGMLTCHSITLMGGVLKGDPLDLKMFESTGWILEEANVADDTKYDLLFPTTIKPPKDFHTSNVSFGVPEHNDDDDMDLGDNATRTTDTNSDRENLEIGIVREFSFTSSLQRMSVITRRLADDNFVVYCKGSPEMVYTLCKPETIPADFHQKLDIYAQQGYRVISLAYKVLDKKLKYPKIQRISRDKIEHELNFLGFVILENRLKEDTTDIIKNLTLANIRTVMVTGDNILTALSVAKDCGIIKKNQNVIIVNHRTINNDNDLDDDDENNYELYYNLAGHTGPIHNIMNSGATPSITAATTPIQNGVRIEDSNDYELMTNSNSVASLETITQTTILSTATSNHDIEKGFNDLNHHRVAHSKDNDLIQNFDELNNYRFAIIGKTWQIVKDYFPELLPKLVTRGSIFARMSPDQKQALIMELQQLGYYVAMCGDGANDCGALKVAHTGISLSDAESSVASPFTSKNPTIACVPNVIKEGRAALVTSFGIFKYMAAYSLVQFSSVLILYSIDSNLTDLEFLYIDLFMISIFAFFFGKTESYDGDLVKQAPLNSLISLSPIVSLLLHLIVAIVFQLTGWYHVRQQEWFIPFNYTSDTDINDLGCHENYTVFIISCFQYIILAIVFSKGAPYRKSIISNYGFLISIVCNVIVTTYLTLIPNDSIADFFSLVVPDDIEFRSYLLIYGGINFILSMFIEFFIVDYILFQKLRYYNHNIEKSRRKYLSIENVLLKDMNWPQLTLYNDDDSRVQVSSQQPHSQQNKLPKNNFYGSPNKKRDDCDDDNLSEQMSPLSYAEIKVEENEGNMNNCDDSNRILNGFFMEEINEQPSTPTSEQTPQQSVSSASPTLSNPSDKPKPLSHDNENDNSNNNITADYNNKTKNDDFEMINMLNASSNILKYIQTDS